MTARLAMVEDFAAGVVIAFGRCQNFLCGGRVRLRSLFDSCHDSSLTNHLLDGFNAAFVHHDSATQPAFTLGGFFGQDVTRVECERL